MLRFSSGKTAIKDTFGEKRLFASRVMVAALIILALLGVLVWRYFTLQIIDHDIYRTASERNRVQLQPVAPKRGLIYDRNGVLLAENRPSYSLVVVKEQVGDFDAVLRELGELVALDDELLEKFHQRVQRRRPYEAVPLKFNLSEAEIALIAAHQYRLPGVDVEAQLVRHYPLGEHFAHVLGYVGRISEEELDDIDPTNYAGTHQIGKIGLEKYYENLLHGTVGYQNVETNARGRVLRVLERQDPVPGADLVLHLDVRLQQAAYDAFGEELGALVAIDTATGGVLALVSAPGFDPNLFVTGIGAKDYAALRDSPDRPLYNRALQGQYPPASTIKPFYGLAGLHYGLATAGSTVADPGWFRLPGDERKYRDWKPWGHMARINVSQAIEVSCDVYFYDLAHRMGIDRMQAFLAQFGYGQRTGIDTTSEMGGLLPSRDWKRKMRNQAWYPGETISMGIGQGYLLATPMQMAFATATMASRGAMRFSPRLLREAGGKPVEAPTLAPFQVAPAHWDLIHSAMEDVVHGSMGTARALGAELNYRMAGKTGTAQVVGIAQDAKYDAAKLQKRQRDHALFIGYAPAEAPQIAVAAIMENGEKSGRAAAVVRQVIDAYLASLPAAVPATLPTAAAPAAGER